MKKISLVLVFSLSVLTSNQFLLADDPQTRPGGCPDPPCQTIDKGKSKKLNINTAGENELMSVKGIGKSRARAIISYREKNGPFKTVDELAKVKGIKEKALGEFRGQITAE